jgi:hypothetical protein
MPEGGGQVSELTFEDAHQVDESIRRARQILDARLRGLTLASRFWKMTLVSTKQERIAFAHELDQYGLFSLTQLAKITRTHKQTLAKVLGAKKRGGGRFEPEALTALVMLRKQVIARETLSKSMLEKLAHEGTSVSCACRLIGVTATQWYARINHTGRWAA